MCSGKQMDLLENRSSSPDRIGSKLWTLDNLPGFSMRMVSVLRAIQSKARSSESATMSHREISVMSGAKPSTVKRAIRDLEESGFLICRHNCKSGQGKQANTYQIAWANLKAYANGERDETTQENEFTPIGHIEPCTGHIEPTPQVILDQPIGQGDLSYNIPRKTVLQRNSMEHGNGVLEKQSPEKLFSFGRKLERDDFYQPERMQSLYERVLSENLINGSEVDRQLFYGLLVYVRRQDKKKVQRKSGFLVSLLRGTVKDKFDQDWRKRPTHEDTRNASKIINKLDYGPALDEVASQ